MPPLMAAAVEKANLGFRVVPLLPRGKEPLDRRWPDVALDDVEAVVSRWEGHPDANHGVLCGEGYVVLDSDSARAEDALRELSLPPTPTVRTDRGFHRYFKGHTRGSSLLDGLPKVELRGERQYAVGAGSIHPSGREYVWEVGPWEIAFALLPDEVGALARPIRKLPVRDLRRVIPKGRRNVSLTRIAGSLRGMSGLSDEALGVALHRENAARCRPPLPESEVNRIVRSACRWGQPPLWLTDPMTFVADPRLRAPARFLLLTLCDHARHDEIAFPGYRRIRERTGMAKDTIERYTHELEAATRVTVERSPRRVNRYRILPWRPCDLGAVESGSYVPASRTAA